MIPKLPKMRPYVNTYGDWLTIRLDWRKPVIVTARVMRATKRTIGTLYEGRGATALEAMANMKRTRITF